MPTEITNSSNIQTVSSVARTVAKLATPSSTQAAQLPGSAPQSAETVRQNLPVVQVNTPEKVEQTVEKLNVQVQNLGHELSFSVDKVLGRTVVKVLDSKTNEVIRQVPAESVLKIARQIEAILSEASEQVSGILLEEQA